MSDNFSSAPITTDSGDVEAGATRPHVADFTPETLADWFAKLPAPHNRPFRAKQILTHFYHRLAGDYAEMTDLPADLRERLAVELPLDPLQIVSSHDDSSGSTKLAIRPKAGVPKQGGAGIIECMIMRDFQRDSRTICVSSQVGCAMGCNFCASGLDGLLRNLTASEIIGQIWHAARILAAEGYTSAPSDGRRGRRQRQHDGDSAERNAPTITNIVFMGVGEPMANWANVSLALKALTEPWGFGLSARRITVSTVGLLKGIYALADSGLGINLAISLHAADDATRAKIIPTRPGKAPDEFEPERQADVDKLLDAGDHFFAKTGREVTIEFILLPEVNGHQAKKLADLIARHPKGKYNVNVIPYNRVEEFPWREATGEEIHHFLDDLRSRGINAHARKRMGYGIDGACGQLRLHRG